MNPFMDQAAELDAAAARTIAAAMREVARADGDHPAEEKIIDAFIADLPPGPHTVDLSTIDTPLKREAFLKSLLLVAFADGQVSEAENALIHNYAVALGVSAPLLTRAVADVASALLSSFAGVQLFRDQVLALGEQLGLSKAQVGAALKD